MSPAASRPQSRHGPASTCLHTISLEAAGVPYTDIANEKKDGYSEVQAAISPTATSVSSNPPFLAPPLLRVPGAGPDDAPLVISQTPNILNYLGPRVGLQPSATDDEPAHYTIAGLVLTALDLSNETHDAHHPVGISLYYEDQKPESLRKATEFRKLRIPKYLGYFERVLKGNEAKGKGKFLVGDALTTADTTVWQVVDGLKFAFPKELKAREEEFPLLLGGLYEAVKADAGIAAYLKSERRLPYSQGLFRHYPELDRQE